MSSRDPADSCIEPSIGIALIVGALFLLLHWLKSQPAWLLTAKNTAEGVQVEIYKERDDEPTFVTLPEDQEILRDIERVSRQDLPPEIGTTMFHDETFKPGRWTLELAGVKLDIMPSRLVLEDGTNLFPTEANQ